MADTIFRAIEQHPHELKDEDTTPRASHDLFHFGTSGLTPSIMDHNNHGFSMFPNHMQGYYTPTSGDAGAFYHNQAGDLHTPGFGATLDTPLSLPTSEGALHAAHQVTAFQGYHNQLSQQQHFHPHAFQHIDPYQQHHVTSYAPHHFTHQSSFDQLDGHLGDSPGDDLGMDMHLQQQQHSPHMPFHSQTLHNAMKPMHVHPSAEKYVRKFNRASDATLLTLCRFRYHVTLNAPTAMIKHADEIPITYLNKGQAYTLNVVDTQIKHHSMPVKYRTFVRVSFEDEQQRLKPSACWQLWKEGRGTNEAHQRGGRLQAVEYVESGQMGVAEDPIKPRIELECASFDGFCVQWTPADGTMECPISVRFNFLSTDFSHSKGVKGIPVRLCTKTEIMDDPQSGPAEVCYGKVKLFRDHGAERKLSNDVAHVKKTIDKLNQQIQQVESGMKDLGKRKRSGSMAKLGGLEHRPGKMAKHRRTWSVSSITSGGGRGSAEDELYTKLTNLQDMFTSTRPASVLYLRGAEEDDPDVHPVILSGDLLEPIRNDSVDVAWEDRQSSLTQAASSVSSDSPGASSTHASRREPKLQQPTPLSGGASRMNSNEWPSHQQPLPTMEIEPSPPVRPQLMSPPDQIPIKVQSRSPKAEATSGWIEALDVDQTYQPPLEQAAKAIACFYIQPRGVNQPPQDDLYRAIYLYSRTLNDFVRAAALKCGIDSSRVTKTTRLNLNGLHSLFEDDCVLELPEGQDMIATFTVDTNNGYELQLLF